MWPVWILRNVFRRLVVALFSPPSLSLSLSLSSKPPNCERMGRFVGAAAKEKWFPIPEDKQAAAPRLAR